VDIDHGALFDTQTVQGVPSGLYVSRYDGDCDVDDVNVGAGEAALVRAEPRLKLRLDGRPAFQSEDPWLDEARLNLYNDLLHEISDDGFECRVAL